MITTDAQLQQAVEQMARLFRALHELRGEVAQRDPGLFAVMAEGPLDMIEQLRAQIDEYTGVAAMRERDVDVWIRLHGPEIEWENAPTSVLTTFVDALRKGVQMVAEFLDKGALAPRPTNELKQACDLRLVTMASGSVRLGLRLPAGHVTEPGGSSKRHVAEKALEKYLDAAAWAAAGAETEIDAVISDPRERRVVLSALKPLIPSRRGAVDFLEIQGRGPQRPPVRLAGQARKKVDDAITRSVSERIETRTGTIREIDLDERTFLLRVGDDANVTRCTFSEDLYEAAKDAFDRHVRVRGAMRHSEGRRGATMLSVQQIEVLDEGGDEEDLA